MLALRIVYDIYTPAVEAQITRDLIALKNNAPKESFSIICDKDDGESLFNAFNLSVFKEGKSSLTILYKVGEQWPEHPDATEEPIIERDLYVSEELISIDPNPGVGYYMPQQGRPIRNQVDLSRRGPQGQGAIDPALLLVWGGPGMDYGNGVM